MEIKDVQANKGNIDVVLEVVKKEEPREFEKFGKKGKVCNAKVRDASGEITLTLWNDDIDKVSVGDVVRLHNGWCSEFKGEKQLSTGKFGKIELLESGAARTIITNDPESFLGSKSKSGNAEGDDDEEVDEDQGEEPFDENEY